MVCTNLCPFDNTNCMCQFCENPCNNGLNCSDCQFHNKIMFDYQGVLYCSYRADYIVMPENTFQEIKGSDFYKIMEEMED